MVLQLKLFSVLVIFAPIFCAALLKDAFDSNVELLAEETDLNAVNVRAQRAAGYFYPHEHYPSFQILPGPKGYLPPPRYGHHNGYGNGYDSDDDEYDYDDPCEGHPHRSHHQHHHRHHTGGSHRQGSANRGVSKNVNKGGFVPVQNPFFPTNNNRPLVVTTPQGPSRVKNPFFRPNTGGSIQVPNTFPPSIDRPIVAIPSQPPTVVNNPRPVVTPRPVIITTPQLSDPPTQVVATPPTSTATPVAEGDPFNIDIRFGN